MPADDKAEKFRAIKGDGKAFRQWKYPLPGCFVDRAEHDDVLRGIISDRLRKLGW